MLSKLFVCAIALTVACGCSGFAQAAGSADNAVFMETVSAEGTLNGLMFDSFTLTGYGNTSAIQHPSDGNEELILDSVQIVSHSPSQNAVTTYFVNPVVVFESSPNSVVGFYEDQSGNNIGDAAGPIGLSQPEGLERSSFFEGIAVGATDVSYAVYGGSLTVTAFTGGASFVETVSPTAPAAPEPSTWALLIVGILGLGLALRRAKTGTRRRSAALVDA